MICQEFQNQAPKKKYHYRYPDADSVINHPKCLENQFFSKRRELSFVPVFKHLESQVQGFSLMVPCGGTNNTGTIFMPQMNVKPKKTNHAENKHN